MFDIFRQKYSQDREKRRSPLPISMPNPFLSYKDDDLKPLPDPKQDRSKPDIQPMPKPDTPGTLDTIKSLDDWSLKLYKPKVDKYTARAGLMDLASNLATLGLVPLTWGGMGWSSLTGNENNPLNRAADTLAERIANVNAATEWAFKNRGYPGIGFQLNTPYTGPVSMGTTDLIPIAPGAKPTGAAAKATARLADDVADVLQKYRMSQIASNRLDRIVDEANRAARHSLRKDLLQTDTLQRAKQVARTESAAKLTQGIRSTQRYAENGSPYLEMSFTTSVGFRPMDVTLRINDWKGDRFVYDLLVNGKHVVREETGRDLSNLYNALTMSGLVDYSDTNRWAGILKTMDQYFTRHKLLE